MDEIKKALELAMPRIANRFRTELVLISPVLTGRLRSSIVVKAEGNTIVVTMVDYAMFVEFGTNRQRPNPFIRNTIRNKVPQIIQEEILRAIS